MRAEVNVVAAVIWQNAYSPKNSARHFSEDRDYVVVYARQQVQVERDKSNRLHDEFLTWWIPQRRKELHQLSNRLLTATAPRPAQHPSDRVPGESDFEP